MRIIQLADLHLTDKKAPAIPLRILKEKLTDVFRTDDKNETILCVCGDVVFQGDTNGYNTAERFLRQLMTEAGISKERVFVCPGNHDLEISRKDFTGFNRFVYALTKNASMLATSGYAPPAIMYNDTAFVLVNSSSHLDHRYGLVDTDLLGKTLSSVKAENIVLCLHHHLIPNHEFSCVKNSYELMRICEEKNVKIILHGHRHMGSLMTISKSNFFVCGAGSASLDLRTSGYTNQFNLITNTKDWSQVTVTAFRYLTDKLSGGETKGFSEETVRYEK